MQPCVLKHIQQNLHLRHRCADHDMFCVCYRLSYAAHGLPLGNVAMGPSANLRMASTSCAQCQRHPKYKTEVSAIAFCKAFLPVLFSANGGVTLHAACPHRHNAPKPGIDGVGTIPCHGKRLTRSCMVLVGVQDICCHRKLHVWRQVQVHPQSKMLTQIAVSHMSVSSGH